MRSQCKTHGCAELLCGCPTQALETGKRVELRAGDGIEITEYSPIGDINEYMGLAREEEWPYKMTIYDMNQLMIETLEHFRFNARDPHDRAKAKITLIKIKEREDESS